MRLVYFMDDDGISMKYTLRKSFVDIKGKYLNIYCWTYANGCAFKSVGKFTLAME